MTTSTGPLSKEGAYETVAAIIKSQPTEFDLVPFEDFRSYTKLRSQRYNGFHVLCYKNTRKTSGWLVCRYVLTRSCNLKSGIMAFNTTDRGTGKFERHSKSHQNRMKPSLCIERPLPAMSKTIISRADALAVVQDLRPLSFTDNKPGMRMFVDAVFCVGQQTPVGDRIEPSSLMSSAKSVTNALKNLAPDSWDEYKGFLIDRMDETGGGLPTDEVTLKVQDRQFLDLTLHSVNIKGLNSLDAEPKVEMKAITLLLKEKPEAGDASTIRSTLENHLKAHYNKDIDWLTKRFTMVTDCASVMARVALSSVSTRVAPMDQK